MNTDVAVLQNELTILKQQNEINELRYKLQITQAEKASKLEDSLFSPELYEHYQKVAVMMSKSEIVPNSYRGKPADIFIAMEMGYQLGFPIAQSLQDIAVINGRPCLWGDGLLALVLSHKECEGINEEPLTDDKGNVIGYRCTVSRKGYKPREQVFTLQDAQAAGLLKKAGPWTQYPKRMLQMRARAFALRDVFGDALRGFKIAEEQQDAEIIDVEVIQKPKTTQTDKLKQILGIGDLDNEAKNYGNNDGNNSTESGSSELNNLPSSQNVEEDSGSEREITSRDNLRISTIEQLARIEELFVEKGFSQERIKKALSYYEVEAPSELLDSTTADEFISQLERAK
jgi:hypothetical protein